MRPLVKEWGDLMYEVRMIDNLKISALVQNQIDCVTAQNDDRSFFLYNLGSIVDKYRKWTACLPNVVPSYVVGTDGDLKVVAALSKLGARFSCANKNEIQALLNAGVEGSRIVFCNPVKQASHIKFCAKVGVETLAFDSELELKKIRAHYPSAKLVLQVSTGQDAGACDWLRGCKVRVTRDLLRTAMTLGLDVCGVSAVVDRRGEGSMVRAVEVLREVYDIAVEEGVELKLIDVGDVFCDWTPESCSFNQRGDLLSKLLKNNFDDVTGVEFVGQCGRYMVAESLTLVTSVIAKRPVSGVNHDEDSCGVDKTRFHYYLNDGVYQSFARLLCDNSLTVSPQLAKVDDDGIDGKEYYPSRLMGPSCDDLDCVVPSCDLPELSVGDWLIFNNMGGVTATQKSQSDVCFYVIGSHQWDVLNGDITYCAYECLEPEILERDESYTAQHDNNNNNSDWLDI